MIPTELADISSRARLLASRLRFCLARRTWRGGAGEFQGRDVGSSLDFQDHRDYAPGDDPRRINWQAYARTGHYTMKLFREEVRPVIDLAFDASSSMFAFPDKAVRSLELLYFLTLAAVSSGASVHVFLLRGGAVSPIDPEALLAHRWQPLVEAMPESGPAAQAPALGATPFRSHSFRLLLSDLLFPGDPAPLVHLLASHHGSGAILAPFSPAEAAPSWLGNYELVDPELQASRHRRIDVRLLTRYRETYGHHFALWKEAARKAGQPLARVDSSLPLAESLQPEALRFQILELAP